MERVGFFLSTLRGKILDVGFSSGTLHSQVIKKFGGENVTGIDVDFHRDHRGNYVVASAEKMPLRSASFDSILAGEIIEHLHNPELFVKESYRVLKKGGILVMSTPNKKSLVNRVFRSYEAPLHFHLFDRGEIESLLGETGFKVKTFFCLPFTPESCDGSSMPGLFFLRGFLHHFLPRSLQEDMVIVAEK